MHLQFCTVRHTGSKHDYDRDHNDRCDSTSGELESTLLRSRSTSVTWILRVVVAAIVAGRGKLASRRRVLSKGEKREEKGEEERPAHGVGI